MNDEFIKAPIYYKRSWPIENDGEDFYINPKNSQEIIDFFRGGNDKLKTYCVECKDDESFTSNCKLIFHRDMYGNSSIKYDNRSLFRTYENNKIYFHKGDMGITSLKTEILKCNLNSNHEYVIYYSLFCDENEFTITKVGQNISPYEIGLPEVKTYEKQLRQFDAVDDYRRVFIHRIHNDSVAALLYLRRVFEKMVIKLLDGAELTDNHFATKIKTLKDDNKLNPEVNELTKSVYELLSKGIHELNNEECTTLFGSLNLFIEMQLIYIKTEEEKQQKLLKLKKDVTANHGKYN